MIKKNLIIVIAVSVVIAALAVLVLYPGKTASVADENTEAGTVQADEMPISNDVTEIYENIEPDESDIKYEIIDGESEQNDSGGTVESQYTPQPTKAPIIIEVQEEQSTDESVTVTPSPSPTPDSGTKSVDEIGRITF